jgi:hypothetical protein
MNRRRLLHALFIPILAGGCTAPGGQPPETMRPPVGAITAAAAYPPIGAKWNVRVTEGTVFHSTVEDREITAASVMLDGRRGYGLVSPAITSVLDPATFNPIGTIEGGKVAVTDIPDTGLFSWPLWVGKSWGATYSHADRLYGAAWPPAKSQARVTAFEDVTVPAGTFKAFRIEYQGGIGSEALSGFRNPGPPGFGTRETHWYAPDPKMIVKSEIVRLGTNYRWAGWTTTELLSPPR